MIETVEALRLNLGARDTIIHGYKNLDCDAHPGVDYVGNIEDLSQFASASVESIYASHCLEHISHTRTLAALVEWARVLRPGGILYVAVPDFKRMAELYLTSGLSDWLVNFIHGDHGYATAFHYAAFDFKRLHSLLLSAGFSEASQVDRFGLSDTDCSNLKSNLDWKSVSLNAVAIR